MWGWIEDGRTSRQIEHMASQRYDAPSEEITTAVGEFLDRLIEHELVRETELTETDSTGDAMLQRGASVPRTPFVRPELSIHTDMQDLLLLDPIHDVSEIGWPKAKEDEPAERA